MGKSAIIIICCNLEELKGPFWPGLGVQWISWGAAHVMLGHLSLVQRRWDPHRCPSTFIEVFSALCWILRTSFNFINYFEVKNCACIYVCLDIKVSKECSLKALWRSMWFPNRKESLCLAVFVKVVNCKNDLNLVYMLQKKSCIIIFSSFVKFLMGSKKAQDIVYVNYFLVV